MYSKAGVSGPDEFGQLPKKDRMFWRSWMKEHLEREDELLEKLKKKLG
jgi:hypothetical protein